MRIAYIAVALSAFAVGAASTRASFAQEVITPAPEVVYFGNPSSAPFKWAGKLVMPNPAQAGYSILCTAQFITPNVLLTAGHCLKDLPSYPTGPWPDPSKGQFLLQYQNRQYTQAFNVVCGLTNPLWSYPSNYNTLTAAQQQAAVVAAWPHDFAMVLVNPARPA